MTDPDHLILEENEGLLELWLNRPEKRNALNETMVDALREAVASAEARKDVRVVVLRGRGPDFCSGADLAELERVTEMGPEASLRDARKLGGLYLALRRLPKPVVAAVQGRALAGGCGLVTACDLVLASENAEFGYPEIHLGFVPAMVMAFLRRKVTEGRAFELVTSGRRIGAEEACRLGLVNRVLEERGFDAQVRTICLDLARKPPSAVALTKSLLYEMDDLSVEDGVERGAEVNVEARMNPECKAGVRSFLQRRSSGDT